MYAHTYTYIYIYIYIHLRPRTRIWVFPRARPTYRTCQRWHPYPHHHSSRNCLSSMVVSLLHAT